MASNSTVLVEIDVSRSVVSDLPPRGIKRRDAENQASGLASKTADHSHGAAGDQINRFLLCTLVGESAKGIKASAARMGESLPMTMIVRAVLRSYRLAAKDEDGPLFESQVDLAGLRSLNAEVLKDVLAHNSRDRVKNSETRVASAARVHDDARIKTEKAELARVIELRDRLAETFR